MVHDVLQSFARSLKHFVQSREFLEQRRLNTLLRQAQLAALNLKDAVKATDSLHYALPLTSSKLASLSQWVLHDPAMQALPGAMLDGEAAPIGLESVGELVAQSEIDFRSLKRNVLAVLERQSQASVADVLRAHPATQGLRSVLGLLALGSRHGLVAGHSESVSRTGGDHQARSANIPVVGACWACRYCRSRWCCTRRKKQPRGSASASAGTAPASASRTCAPGARR